MKALGTAKSEDIALRVSQFIDDNGHRAMCATDCHGVSRVLRGTADLRTLALEAILADRSLTDLIGERTTDTVVDLEAALENNRVLVPVDHPDPAHLLVSGSGLSHKSWLACEPDHGSDESAWPPHYKILMLGQRGGKPPTGTFGSQPEWFYKGTGDILVPPGGAIPHPDWGHGIGEEAEIAGIYIVGPDRKPFCIGYTLGNEFSDELMFFANVYHTAHSKRRHVSLGPEVLMGPLPQDIEARISLQRAGAVQWQADFRTGEFNMLHSIANIEAHYFKYRHWFVPGDVHVLFYGNSVMSTAQGEVIEDGDIFRLDCALFGLPLVNVIEFADPASPCVATPLW